MGYDNYAIDQENTEDGSGLVIRLYDYGAHNFINDLRRLNTLPEYDRKFPVPVRDHDSTWERRFLLSSNQSVQDVV